MRPGAQARIAGAGVALAIALSAMFGALHLAAAQSPLDALEAAASDLRLLAAGPSAPTDEVVIVGIDDAAIDALGGRFPLSRAALAAVIDATVGAGARTVALDVVLAGTTDETADAALVTALSRHPATIAAAATFDGQSRAPLPVASSVISPEPSFAAVAAAGMANIAMSATGAPQHIPLLILTAAGPVAHLALQAAALHRNVEPVLAADAVAVGGVPVPLDAGFSLPVRIAGPSGTIATVSAADLLAGQDGARVADRLAVIGFTAAAVGDRFPTPYDPVTPGVEILAAAAGTLLGGPGLTRTVGLRRVDVAVAAGLGIGAAVVIAFGGLGAGVPVAIFALAAWLVVGGIAFASGVWLAAALPAAVVVPVTVATGALRHRFDRRRDQVQRDALDRLRRLHPPALAARLAMDPQYLEVPITARLAIVFIDLTGFTGISETVGVARTEALLQRFHVAVAEAVNSRGGVLMNFMGDGALAVFGLPEPTPHDAAHAIASAAAAVAAVQRMTPPDGVATLDARASVHVADVAVSRLGPASHQHVTVTGDGVNVASRLLGIAKEAGMRVAASREALLAAGPVSPADQETIVAIRGRTGTIAVALWRLDQAATDGVAGAVGAVGAADGVAGVAGVAGASDGVAGASDGVAGATPLVVPG